MGQELDAHWWSTDAKKKKKMEDGLNIKLKQGPSSGTDEHEANVTI